MRVMRLRVITALLPATEYRLLSSPLSVSCSTLSQQRHFSAIFPPSFPSLTLSAISWWLHLPHLSSPAVMFILLSSHHSSSLDPARGCAMCSLLFSDKVFKSLELSMAAQDMNHQLLFILQLDSIILGYHADGANKVHGFWIPACIFMSLDHQSMGLSHTDKIKNSNTVPHKTLLKE